MAIIHRLMGIAVVGVVATGGVGLRPTPVALAAEAPTAGSREVTIPIADMACDSCAEHLERRLGRVEGVLKATVDFEEKEARVNFDPKRVTVAALVAEINKSFTAGKPREAGAR